MAIYIVASLLFLHFNVGDFIEKILRNVVNKNGQVDEK